MDEIDIRLLEILSANAEQTATELAKQINLSVPAINKRIAKLKNSGVIKNFTIQTDPKKIGKTITAFIMVWVEEYPKQKSFLDYISADRDIVECHAVTGEYDYLIKLYADNMDSMKEKMFRLKKVQGVVKTYTIFSLAEHKNVMGPLPDPSKAE